MSHPENDAQYTGLQVNAGVEAIKAAILQSQAHTLGIANGNQLALYYAIGKFVSINSRKGYWGKGILESISKKLQYELPGLRGFSPSNLKNMRSFAEEWQIFEDFTNLPQPAQDAEYKLTSNSSDASDELRPLSHTASDNSLLINPFELISIINRPMRQTMSGVLNPNDFLSLSFSHHIAILTGAKDLNERIYYIHQSVINRWNYRHLRKQLNDDAYHHQGAMPNNFVQTLNSPKQAFRAIQMFKDSYLLDYLNTEELGIRDEEDIDERIIEQGIVQNIKRFILTFGQDFAFMGNQYRIDAMGHSHFIDLLFFNRELNCMVAIELKSGALKNAYLGQLNAYLNLLDDYVRKPHENPTIGIVLCKDVDNNYAEYMVRTYQKPMGVASYCTSANMPEKVRKALPEIEDLKRLL